MDDLAGRSRRTVTYLAVILLIGTFLPIYSASWDSSGWSVPNIAAIYQTDGGPGVLDRFMLAYPLIACVVALYLAWRTKPVVRGIGLLALGVLPWVLLWAQSASMGDPYHRSGRSLSSALYEMGGGRMMWMMPLMVLGLLSWTGLFVGSRSRKLRPSSEVAHAFGVAGAGCFLAAFLTAAYFGPSMFSPDYEYYRYSNESLWDHPGQIAYQFGAMAVLGLMAATAVLCLLNSARNDNETARRRATLSYRFFLYAHALLGAILAITFAVIVYSQDESFRAVFGVLVLAKLMMMSLPIVLMVPFGLSDIIVGEGEPAEAQPAAAAPGIAPAPPGPAEKEPAAPEM